MNLKLLFTLVLLAGCGAPDVEEMPTLRPDEIMRAGFDKSIDNWEASSRKEAEDFELMRKLKYFLARETDATLPIMTLPKGAIATLHDHETGAPLETCQTPCSLNGKSGEKYVIVAYKTGHHVHTRFITAKKKGFNLGGLDMGPDYYAVLKKAKQCAQGFNPHTSEDQDAAPCVRPPPLMPINAEKSGYCNVMFDVTEAGDTRDIRIVRCSDDVFSEASLYAVRWWFYSPKVKDGKAVRQSNIRSRLSFKLRDEDGNLISEWDP